MAIASQATADCIGSEVSLPLLGINAFYAVFWQKETEAQDRLMMNEANLEIAFEWLKEEYSGPIPIKYKKSYGEIIKLVNTFRVIGLKHQARQGGKAPRTGPLQHFIIRCVQSVPDIRERQLLHLLKKQSGFAIDQESDCLAGEPRKVHFIDENGDEESAPLSALKDRLYRAKRKIRAKR